MSVIKLRRGEKNALKNLQIVSHQIKGFGKYIDYLNHELEAVEMGYDPISNDRLSKQQIVKRKDKLVRKINSFTKRIRALSQTFHPSPFPFSFKQTSPLESL